MGSSQPRDFEGTERFSVERCLGSGSFGVVYQAFDRERNTVIALKRLRRPDATSLYRFKREFRALADLSHPNLVALYELLSDGEEWFFTMELLKGVNFLQYVREDFAQRGSFFSASSPTKSAVDTKAPLNTTALPIRHDGLAESQGSEPAPLSPVSLHRLRVALKQLAKGVLALHEAGILHRDIKPSNVLVTEGGRVVLLDFGLLAQFTPTDKERSVNIVGTPAYMSPEQGAGLRVSEASDWYSVGMILFESLTGRLPFHDPTREALLERQLTDAPPPSELVQSVPGDLDALCQALLQRDPDRRPSGREILNRLSSVPVTPPRAIPALPSSVLATRLVGREPHLAALRKSFEAMKEGHAVTVLVHGGSGMGKTSLVRRFLERLVETEHDIVVLTGRCYERESVPYKALDSLVDHLSQYMKRLPSTAVEALLPRDVLALARLFPVLRQVEAVATARRRVREIPDSVEMRRRAFAGLRELLTRLSDRKPLVLFIDDLQWGDVDSAALLAELLGPPDPPSLLLIGCYRSEEAPTSPMLRKLLPLRGTTGWLGDSKEVKVGELTPAEARDLALTLLGEEMSASTARAQAIARESAGSPFFINELVQYALGGGAPADEADAMPPASADNEIMRVTLDKVIQARVSRLPEAAQRLLVVVAVSGQPVELSVARRAAESESEEQDVLALLQAQHLIRSRGTESGDEIEPYHDRIREALVAQIPPERVKDYHRRLARALEVSDRADPETLANHFQAADDTDAAAEYAAAAATQAAKALAFDRAARLYQLALDLCSSDSVERHELQVSLGNALANAGRGAEAARVYLAGVHAASAAEAIELQRRAAQQLLISGQIDEGLRVARTVLGTIGLRIAETPRRALLSLLLRRAQIRLRGLKFRERDATQVSPEELFRIDTCWSVAEGLAVVDPIRSADIQTRNLLLALRAGEPYRVSRALAMEAALCSTSGGRSRRRTKKLLEAATRLAERVNHPHATGLVTLVTGVVAYLEGRWLTAREHLEHAEEILRERCTGVTWELFNSQFFLIAALFWLGELKALSRRLPMVLKDAMERGDLFAATQLRTHRPVAAAYLAADAPDEAREEGRRAIEGWSQEGFHVQHLGETQGQVDVALYCGDGKTAWTIISGRWPAFSRSLLQRVQNLLIPTLAARANSALGAVADGSEPSSLLRVAERDARAIEREKMAWGDPLALLIRAGVAATRDRFTAAAALLVSAERGFEAADMSLYAAASRRRHGELLGGQVGRALMEDADTWMFAQDIRDPARMTAMLAPGRWTRRD